MEKTPQLNNEDSHKKPLERTENDGEILFRLLNQQRRIFKRIAYVLYSIIQELDVGLVFSKNDLMKKLSMEPIDPLEKTFTLQLSPDTAKYNMARSDSFRRFHYSQEELGGQVSIEGAASSKSVNMCIDFNESPRNLIFGQQVSARSDLGTGYHSVRVHRTDSRKLKIIVDDDEVYEGESPAQIIEDCRERYTHVLRQLTELIYNHTYGEIGPAILTQDMVRKAIVECRYPPFSRQQKLFIGEFVPQDPAKKSPFEISQKLSRGIKLGPFRLSSSGGVEDPLVKGAHKLVLSIAYKAKSPKTPYKIKKLNRGDYKKFSG